MVIVIAMCNAFCNWKYNIRKYNMIILRFNLSEKLHKQVNAICYVYSTCEMYTFSSKTLKTRFDFYDKRRNHKIKTNQDYRNASNKIGRIQLKEVWQKQPEIHHVSSDR